MVRLWSLAVDAAGAACAELLDTLWPSEATGTAEALLVEAEEARDVFEPLPVPETMVGFYDCPCGGCIEIFADDDPTEARARFDLWADRHRDCRIECEDRGCDAVHSPTDCPGCSDLCCPGPPASATIPPVVDRPEPPAFASVVEAPGTPDSSAPENSTTTSGAGADDQPTSRLLSDLALWLCRLQSRGPLSGSVFAAQVSPMLEAAFERAADFRDIEAAQREADQRVTAQLDQLYPNR